MQDESGVRKILNDGVFYDFLQNILGAGKARVWLAENYWNVKKGDSIIDIGCGTGEVLDYLDFDIQYTGFDVSKKYIDVARKKYGNRGKFSIGTAEEFLRNPNTLPEADLVLCNGLLHHLEDKEVMQVLELSKELLAEKGRLVCVEPVFLKKQTKASKWLMSKDRGQNVRSFDEWNKIVGKIFNTFSLDVTTGLIRAPYVHVIITCNNVPDTA
ncbi:class I SAM-dependent methyltransferase [Patescibacteria group bacterium]|nr:class I SAM-dependent methyltransferase [Patescibacteria group bacterium]